MSYELVHTGEGTYSVDWETVRRIVRSRVRAQKQFEHSEIVTESQKSLNPLSWGLPDLHSVEVPWEKVNTETQATADAEYMALRWNAYSSMRSQIKSLRAMQGDTRRWRDLFSEKLHRAQAQTMSNIEKSVEGYGTAVTGAKIVRDASAGTLMVGATVLSGGSAAPFFATLTAGSALKGTAKYQDSGSIGAATMEFTGSFVVGVIPFARGGQALTLGQQFVVVTFEAPWKTATALVEGKMVTESLVAGGVKFVEPFVGQVFRSEAVQTQLNKWVVPTATKLLSGESSEMATKFVSKGAEKLGKYAVGKGIKAGTSAALDAGAEPATGSPTQGGSSAVDSAVLLDDMLLNLAIIDMEKGLGQH